MIENDEYNDIEIFDAAMDEWTSVIAQLWDAFDKPVDAKRLKLYCRQLSSLPLGLLELAVDRAISMHEYNSVPVVGEVWRAARKELVKAGYDPGDNNQFLDECIERWKNSFWRPLLSGGLE